MSEDLRPFQQDTTCPKCGSGEVKTEYKPRHSGGKSPLGGRVSPAPDRLRRECTCGYVWYERTADAEGEA